VDLGCETQGCDLPLDEELQAESNATQLIHDENFKRKAEFYARCAEGGGVECQTLHEAENIIKGIGVGFAGLLGGMGVAGLWEALAPTAASATTAATAACADGNCTNEMEVATTTVYRFANGLQDLVSRLSQVGDPQLRAQIQARIASLSPSELQNLAMMHARGIVQNSPFISTLLNPAAGAATSDPWLRAIAQSTEYLYRFSVPSNLLYYPNTFLSQLETEVLVLADSLVPYLTGIMKNPFAH